MPDLSEPGGAGSTIDALAACVRGDLSPWLARGDRDHQALCRAAEQHGVLGLIAEQVASPAMPRAWAAALTQRARRDAASDLIREGELRTIVAALGDAGVAPIVMKGAHLAYAVYPRPDLRPRVDTDLLIELDRCERADQVLRRQGYTPVPQLTADLVMYQRPYEKRRGAGSAHMVDLHWRTSNPQRFGSVLSYADLASEATPLIRLDPAARGPSPVHALILACVHRVAHHLDAPRLIWNYDIHLLATAFAPSDWDRVAALARERGAAAACLRGLETTRRLFETPIPDFVTRSLALDATSERPIGPYLDPGQRHIVRVLADLRGVGSWRRAMRLTRQHLLPPPIYMREVYAPLSAAPLPVLYARRAWRGARRWLSRS